MSSPLFGTAARLPAATRTLFLSDLHFGDGARSDHFRGQDPSLVALLEEQRSRAEAFVFLGDIFDMPQAWSARRILRAHPRSIAAIRDLTREGRLIFVRGNHDWSVDYASLFPGAERCEAVLIGERILAWHGHQMDLVLNPNARGATAKTYAHSLLERLLRRRLVPPLERFDSAPNRLAHRLAVAWSRLSLARARALRRAGLNKRAARLEDEVRYLARSVHGDLAGLFSATRQRVLGRGFEAVVCGHSHIPGRVQTPRGLYVNTGTWTGGLKTCALWTGERFRVLDLSRDTELGDEHYREIPADTPPTALFDWWARVRGQPKGELHALR